MQTLSFQLFGERQVIPVAFSLYRAVMRVWCVIPLNAALFIAGEETVGQRMWENMSSLILAVGCKCGRKHSRTIKGMSCTMYRYSAKPSVFNLRGFEPIFHESKEKPRLDFFWSRNEECMSLENGLEAGWWIKKKRKIVCGKIERKQIV